MTQFDAGAAELAEAHAVDVEAGRGLADVSLEPTQPVPMDAPVGLDELLPVLDVPVELAVEIGRTTMTIGETLSIGPGSIIALKRMTGEPVDLLVNGKRIARGEVIAIDEEFGFRVTEVESVEF